MGSEQPQIVSRFADQNQWLTMTQTSRKHLIQNKLSRQIVEKHFLQNVAWNEVKQDSLIYQWRKDPRTALCSVQLFQIRKISQEEQPNCMSACSGNQQQTDLLVYTEHIHKLYEHSPKFPLSEREQLIIFRGVIEGIDMLALKFGEFALAKDMVGYNTVRHGKAWIHENYCINTVQIKRQILNSDQRLYWQKEILDSLVGICKLSSIDRTVRSCKLHYPIEYILRNQLFSFKAIREAEEFRDISLSQLHRESLAIKQENYSKNVELSTSRRDSNELISTEDRDRQRVKIFNQTFNTPYDVFEVPQRDKTMLEQHYLQVNNSDLINPNIRVLDAVQTGNRHSHLQSRPMQRPSYNETTLNDAADFNRRHPENRHQHPLYEIKQRPAHYALLDELQDSRSSRASSKMIDKDNIKMVDSWVMVEKHLQSQSSHNPFNRRHPHKKGVVLQESIIMKAPRR